MRALSKEESTYRNIRISRQIYRELLKLKALSEVAKERKVSFDELLSEMIALYQNVVKELIKGLKIDH